MKTEKSNKALWIASIVFIAATLIYIGIQHRKIEKLSDANQLQAVELSTLKDTVAVFISKDSSLTYKLTSVEIEKGNLKKSLELMDIDRKILKNRDIELQKITAALRMELAATGSGTTAVRDTFRQVETDTLYFQKVDDWSNNNLSLFNAEIVNSKLNFDYKYTTGIDIYQEQQRRATFVRVTLTDPNAAITKGSSFFVKPKKRFWEKPWLWGLAGLGTGILISR